MTMPSCACARASAAADLPLAVGPAISTARTLPSLAASILRLDSDMTQVATLISNPAEPALDTQTLARARDALPGAGTPTWLDPGIAADIPFNGSGENDNRA